MVEIIRTDQLEKVGKHLLSGLAPNQRIVSAEVEYYIYNAMDCFTPIEIHAELVSQLDETSQMVYDFERGCQAAVLEMMLTGMKVDNFARYEMLDIYRKRLASLEIKLNCMVEAVWDKPINYNSPAQLISFFYETMNIPKQYRYDKGERKVSTNRDSLESVAELYIYARPIIAMVLAMKDTNETIKVLTKGVDDDGYMRTSFNIGGTENGRYSSSTNVFGTGTNFQNITDDLRHIFVAEDGFRLAYIDQKQAESRDVAYLSGDKNYIKACESGDIHTYVARLVWPNLSWTGNLAQDRIIADKPFYRQFSYRDMAKRGGHAVNYYGKARTIAKHLKVPVELIEAFMEAYFFAFPGIRSWHKETAAWLSSGLPGITPMGHRRYFHGRRWDDATLREAIAYKPQSMTAYYNHIATNRIWQRFRIETYQPKIQLWNTVHDAQLIHYPEEMENELIPEIHKLLEIPVTINGTEITIPWDAAVGWNFGKRKDKKDNNGNIIKVVNPDGLQTWDGNDKRTRQISPKIGLLDRVLS